MRVWGSVTADANHLRLEMCAAISDVVFSDRRLSRLLLAKEGSRYSKAADQLRDHYNGQQGLYSAIVEAAKQAVYAELYYVKKYRLESPCCLYEISEALGQALVEQFLNQGYLNAEEVSREVRLAMLSTIELAEQTQKAEQHKKEVVAGYRAGKFGE